MPQRLRTPPVIAIRGKEQAPVIAITGGKQAPVIRLLSARFSQKLRGFPGFSEDVSAPFLFNRKTRERASNARHRAARAEQAKEQAR
jgi:hypothetical protein